MKLLKPFSIRNRRKNYRFWTIEFYTISIGIDSSEVGSGSNQIQFSATHLEPMLDGSLDYMQLHNIRPMSWNPLGTIFREDSEQTRRLKNYWQLVDKYHVVLDMNLNGAYRVGILLLEL
jgi:hypothetical protein